jgi:small subunit ribosomal protein S20
MPIIQSAKKRLKTSARQTEENQLHRARARTAIKHIRELAAAGKTKEALAEVAKAQSYIDKATKTNAIHANAAARQKARLSAALKAAGNKEMTPARPKVVTKKAAPKTAKPAAKKST